MAIFKPIGAELGHSNSLTSSLDQQTGGFWRVVGSFSAGGDVQVTPSRVIPNIVGGYGGVILSQSYTDVFYNNIFLIPSFIDFGAVVAETSQEFYIWNSHLSPRVLQGITISGGQGLLLHNPTPPPSIYKPLQFTLFSITASTSGPAIIDARYSFIFDTVSKVLSVNGIRAEIWDFLPNWANGYKVSYEYKTEIITSRSQKEQRRALRESARKRLEFTIHAADQKMWRLRALMDAWQDKSFVLPEVTKSSVSTSGMPSGGISITVSHVPNWLHPDAIVVLRSGDRHGIRIVDTVDGDEVTFTSVGNEDWFPGTLIHPGLTGRVQPNQVMNHLTSQVADLSFRYDVLPASEGVVETGVPYEKYNGSEVFLKMPNWTNPLNVTSHWDSESLDYGRGVAEFLPMYNFGTRALQATFLSRDRDEALEIQHFFNRAKGRRGSFYMPTWKPDFMIAEPLSSLNRLMVVQGADLFKYYGTSPVFRHFMIRFHDHSYMIRPVVEISEQDGDTVIDVGSTWPRDIDPSEILMICWLPRWRFASDILTLDWVTDTVAQFQLPVQTLEDLQ